MGAGLDARPPSASAPGATSGPVRTCVGCRSKGSRSVLVRVVVPTDVDAAARAVVMVVDPGRCLPGRGAWLHLDLACLELAERRRAFPRALHLLGPVDAGAVRGYLAAHEAQVPERST